MIDLILNPQNIGLAGSLLGAITPLAALVLFLVLLPRSGRWLRAGLFWVAALSGPLLILLWTVFNAIESRFGLDSVFAACINIAIFCLVGFSLGFVIRLTPPPPSPLAPKNAPKKRRY